MRADRQLIPNGESTIWILPFRPDPSISAFILVSTNKSFQLKVSEKFEEELSIASLM